MSRVLDAVRRRFPDREFARATEHVDHDGKGYQPSEGFELHGKARTWLTMWERSEMDREQWPCEGQP